jgi:hypothetical protein
MTKQNQKAGAEIVSSFDWLCHSFDIRFRHFAARSVSYARHVVRTVSMISVAPSIKRAVMRDAFAFVA